MVFSQELDAIKKESHRSPRPTFGAPTLVWHIGIWPAPEYDWLDADIQIPLDKDGEDRWRKYEKICEHDAKNKTKFFEGINDVLRKLQASSANQFRGRDVDLKLGDPPGWVPSPNFKADHETRNPFKFPVVRENSLALTLWWYSADAEGRPSQAGDPAPEALRVRVQVEAQRDHITLTLYLDAGKAWNQDRISVDEAVAGILRNRIFSGVQDVKAICEARARSREPIEPLVPEHDLGADAADSERKARSLLETADFIYDEIWEAFLRDFGLSLKEIATERGQIFANFRTAVISTSGLPAEEHTEGGSRDAFQRFNSKSNECNAVLRGFWPFVRRMTPYADEKEHVACAVMGYRALYVTALNAYTNYVQGQESKSRLDEVPAGALPEMPDPDDHSRVILPDDERFEHRPMRALLLTKGEPNTHQVGRIVERFNSLGTMRFFALKSYPLVRDASNHIRICGERLDEIVGLWTRTREHIESEYAKTEPHGAIGSNQKASSLSHDEKDKKNEKLSELANRIENHLLDIHADLDAVSKRVPGGLQFRVTRSIFYSDRIRVVVDLLKIENIETWVTYEQFLQRSVMPTYDFIGRTGKRLEALRERLQVITQSIQTSSVYLQTLATRENTEELRNLTAAQESLARRQYWTNVLFSIIGAFFAIISAETVFQVFGYDLSNVLSEFGEYLRGL
jgi:hypothetical protein